jgi:hypothetical protein
MVRVTLCLQLVLLVLLLKQSDAVTDYCSEFLGDATSSSTELIERLLKNQERVGRCLVSGYNMIQVSSLFCDHKYLTEHLNWSKEKW